MKIVSFNVNGLRSRLHQLAALVEKHQPQIIGLQETKVQDVDFPVAAVEELGYHVHFHGQKTHYGVALLSKAAPSEVQLGFPFDGEEAQRRLIVGTFDLPSGARLRVVNGYFPQGENRSHETKFPAKRKFYADLQRYLEQEGRPDDHLLVIGDMNISPTDLDIGIGEDNARRWLRSGKCSFLPEERQWLDGLLGLGLGDTYRQLNPAVNDRFSWFDYRSRGFERDPKRGLRIDLILASSPLQQLCAGAGIDYELRAMEKPSDHCPVWADFDL